MLVQSSVKDTTRGNRSMCSIHTHVQMRAQYSPPLCQLAVPSAHSVFTPFHVTPLKPCLCPFYQPSFRGKERKKERGKKKIGGEAESSSRGEMLASGRDYRRLAESLSAPPPSTPLMELPFFHLSLLEMRTTVGTLPRTRLPSERAAGEGRTY